jgi:hypothetical protein
MLIKHAGFALWIAELLALQSKISTSGNEQRVRIEWQPSRDGKRRVPPKHQDHDGCCPLPTLVVEFRYGKDRKSDAKAGRCGRQMKASTARSITATSSKTASATLKAVSQSPDFPTVRRPRRDSNARHPL